MVLDREAGALLGVLRQQCGPACQGLFGPDAEYLSPGWDLMAIAYKGASDETALTMVYHYPSAEEAGQDVELVRQALTKTPRLTYRGRIWSDSMTLDSVEVCDTFIVAQARTKSRELIGTALNNRDTWGFVPIRRK